MRWLLFVMATLGPCLSHASQKHLVQPGFDWHEPTAWQPAGIPTANDSVFIYGYVNILPGNNAYAKYVFIDLNGWLEVERDLATNTPGRLFLRQAEGDALFNKGKLEIGGRLEICNAPNFGLLNQGELTVLDRAKLQIDSSLVPVHSSGTIVNSGTIEISEALGTNAFTLVNLSTATNYGELTIQYGTNGISNNGLLTNFGDILIDSLGQFGIINNHHIHNGIHSGSKGTITIRNLYGPSSSGLTTNDLDTVVNHGIISISMLHGAIGLSNDGYLLNYDTLCILDAPDYALVNNDGGHINNISGAVIIKNSTGNGILNAEAASLIENHHIIDVSSFDSIGISNHGEFYNHQSASVVGPGWYGIYNESRFINDSTGILSVSGMDQAGSSGIFNGMAHTFTNHGRIDITDMTGTGFWNSGNTVNSARLEFARVEGTNFRNEHSFTNEANALLWIRDHIGLGAVLNFQPADTITNHGTIAIGEAGVDGQGIINHGVFYNFDTIDIDGVYELGIHHTFSGGSVFKNETGAIISISNVVPIFDVAEGLLLGNDTDSLYNAGDLFISDAEIGVNNQGVLYNAGLIHTSMTTTNLQIGVEGTNGAAGESPSKSKIKTESLDPFDNIALVSLPGSHLFLGLAENPVIVYHGAIFEVLGTLETGAFNPE